MSHSIPFHDTYKALLIWLLYASPEQVNERTGRKVRVGRGGTSFRIDLSDRVLPTPGLRKVFPKSAAAETAWYLSGASDVTWMRQHAPFWDKFVEADGKTIASAYGHRWRRHFGRDQIAQGVDTLKQDPSDRRVYISAWDPERDGLGVLGQKNVPCPVGFNLCVLDGELHSTISLRSSDVMVGLPYDVMGHAYLMGAIAASLGVRLGVMQGSLGHAHLYEDHYAIAEECLKQTPVVPSVLIPEFPIHAIEDNMDEYVEYVAKDSKMPGHLWPSYNPKPFVVE